MAISTYKTFLMNKVSGASTYSKLIDIVDFPDLEGTPDAIDVTTLSDGAYHNIPGILSGDTLSFTCNYTSAEYASLKALEGSILDLAVWLGGTVSGGVATPTGSDGKFSFSAYLVVTKNGGGVNEAQRMTITLYKQSDISFE